jgi:hypothetical protein
MARAPAPQSTRRRSLCRCPDCASFLIQTAQTTPSRATEQGREVDDLLRLVGVALLDRSCPECGYADTVGASTLDAAEVYRRDTRTLLRLQSLADSIAAAAPVPPVASPELPAEHTPA